jgi:apolipoprotein N-acyltransferase
MAVNDGIEVLGIVLPVDWPSWIVLGGVAASVVRMRRRILAIGAVLLFTASFPPYSWPTWSFCLAPLVWIWRDPSVRLSRLRLMLEAVMIGFAMGWTSTAFVRAGLPAYGGVIHAAACVVFSAPVVAVAAVMRKLRNQPVALAASAAALTAAGGEVLQAVGGVSWSVTSFALTVGATPLAQWSHWITPFGVSGGLYLMNFLLIPDNSTRLIRRWLGPATGMLLLASTWCGGKLMAAAVSADSLPFSVLLVQPHLKPGDDDSTRPWLPLDRLTRAALSSGATVDLVVWPETSLSESWRDEPHADVETPPWRLTVDDFARMLTPMYGTHSLVGVVLAEVGTKQRHGLPVAEVRRFNCGCLISAQGEITCHFKLALVPLKEALPRRCDFDWIRNRVLPLLKLNPLLTPSREHRPLSFRDRLGIERRIAVSVCYESFLPWLPQYRDADAVDAIVHLVYDGHFVDHPGILQRQIRACQYRAIETRKWNLVCSTWSGSSIIDPAGAVVDQLSAVAGVLGNHTAGRKGM